MGRTIRQLPEASWVAFKNLFSAFFSAALGNTVSFDGVVPGNLSAVTHYGESSTAVAIAEKTVACSGFTLITGAKIIVKFTVTNTASNPTLNVNSTGAKSIYYQGVAISAGNLVANRTYIFVYNGTQYDLIGNITPDVMAIANGGTGATSASTARNNLGLGSIAVQNTPLPVSVGGTGQTALSVVTVGKADTATKATQDGTGKVIADTYETKANAIVNATVSGRQLTFTKGNGDTITLNTQDSDTTYDTATESADGLLSAADKKAINGLADTYLGKTAKASSAVIADNAKNVTGTIAIANGGTGATNTADARKNLFANNLGGTATHLLAITNSWANGGYVSLTDAKTLLGIQQGTVTIYNKFVISGCAITAVSNSRNIILTETGTSSSTGASKFYTDGAIHNLADGMTASVPTNPTNVDVTYYACLVKNISGTYELKIQTTTIGALALYKVVVPANNTAANLNSVIILDIRRIETNYTNFYSARAYASIALSAALSNTNYNINLRAESWDGANIGELAAYDLANNGFKIAATGDADNILVRWCVTSQ